MGRVTLQTIADEVGVSRMTVSNAFSRPDQLSAELRDKILAKAGELGYAGPDPTARSLARGKAGTVGILFTDTFSYAFEDEVAAGFVGAIAAELGSTGSAITLLTSGTGGEFVPARDVALDGAVLYACNDDSEAIGWLVRRQLPLVFVDHRPRPGYDSVNIDDREGARLAAQHLIDLGHRHLAVLTTTYGDDVGIVADPFTATHVVSEQRLLGWFDAIHGAGLEAPVVQAPKHGDSGGAIAALLGLDPRPTGVVCFSDVAAAEAIRAATELGLDVPGDLSVVGFDGTQLAAYAQPSITTVRQDVAQKGRAAATLLVERMSGSAKRARRVVLPVELVVGDSTAPPATPG
ncbi:MAG: LacI family DNA-binding transcriptional regulator [Ilumatobacter sp.]|nr:LacI family DNA-binding transcriptional regulator [Ilumatobacter sp.]